MSTMTLEQIVRRAFQLGQTYWQQADSESWSQNKKADETMAKFNELLADLTSREAKGDETVTGEAVAEITRNGDDISVSWLIEGGIDAMMEGETLYILAMDCPEDGGVELYAHPAAQEAAKPVDVPTTEMCEAGCLAYWGDGWDEDGMKDARLIDMRNMYEAMIAAVQEGAKPNGEMIEVTKEDGNNYCQILSALGMEEEGDPVAEVRRLVEQEAAKAACDSCGGSGDVWDDGGTGCGGKWAKCEWCNNVDASHEDDV